MRDFDTSNGCSRCAARPSLLIATPDGPICEGCLTPPDRIDLGIEDADEEEAQCAHFLAEWRQWVREEGRDPLTGSSDEDGLLF